MKNNKTLSHPIQPLFITDDGILRFKENRIVRYILDTGRKYDIDMNHLAIIDFSQEDREQFAQLIGYSHSGFGELSYVSDETYDTAEAMFDKKLTKIEAENVVLKEKLQKVRDGLKEIAPVVFKICAEDLEY